MSYFVSEAIKVNLFDAVKANSDSIPYRGYIITWQGGYDWTFAHTDYDGAPDSGDHRCGWAQSLGAALADIDDLIAEGV